MATNYVKIQSQTDGKIYVEWKYQTYYHKLDSGKLICVIPVFDIYFQAKSMEEIEPKSQAMTEMFFDYYILDRGNNSLKQLAIKLKTLGFNIPIHLLVQYTKKQAASGKFPSEKVSSNGFSDANRIELSAKKEMAHVA